MNEKNKLILAALSGFSVIAAAAYVGAAQKYTSVYFPNTQINGLAVQQLTPNAVREQLDSELAPYAITIEARTGKESITGKSIGLKLIHDETLDQLLAAQNPYFWGLHLFQENSYQYETPLSYDSELLDQTISSLTCLDPEQMLPPENAHISDYIPGTGYEIIPETNGTTLDKAALKEALTQAILNRTASFSPESAGLYTTPDILSDNEELLTQLQEMNRYQEQTVIYHFGDTQEILPGYVSAQWITTGDDRTPVIQEDLLNAFISDLASRYDTYNQPKEFKTTYGPTVTLTKGHYGWRIDQKKEAAALKEILLSGQGQEREPIYLTRGASRVAPEYGDTYVEINLTAQHLYYYRNGNLVVDSDFVSGNQARRWTTPEGAYPLTYKQKHAVLRGRNYATPVTYWMPFNRGIGMHDATWRNQFGGTIYKTNGSHGCINLPKNAAKLIFETIEPGTPVMCYLLEGTSGAAAPDNTKDPLPST